MDLSVLFLLLVIAYFKLGAGLHVSSDNVSCEVGAYSIKMLEVLIFHIYNTQKLRNQ